MDVLSVQALSKNYGRIQALKKVDLTIKKGTIFGLLGPNGAGKTTLVKAALSLVRVDEGHIVLNQLEHTQKYSRLGLAYLPEKFHFFPYYTVVGMMQFFGKMRNAPPDSLDHSIDQALTDLNVADLKERKLKTLSKGQLQRTALASLLIGQNEFFILDEPFTGLDPLGIKKLKSLIKNLHTEGKTIMINSHILSEMENLCTDIAILHKGSLIVSGETKRLIQHKTLENYFCEVVESQ